MRITDEKTKAAVLSAHGLDRRLFSDDVYDSIVMSLINDYLSQLEDAAEVRAHREDVKQGIVEYTTMDELEKEYGV